MRKIAIISAAGLGLAVIVAALALAQENAPAPAQQVVDTQKARDEVFAAQKERVLQTIAGKDLAQAAIESDRLFSQFADLPGLAQAAYDIAVACADVGQTDSARQLYDYVIAHWPDSVWAIRSQRGIIHAAIKRKDTEATQAALDKLLTDFAQHPDIAGTVYNLAKDYHSLGDRKIAEKLHAYNVEHYAGDKYGLWSQIEIVKAHIADANDAAADAACEKLVKTFASAKSLPHEIYRFGLAYAKAKRPERAEVFYRHVLDHWPASPHTAWARLALLDGEGRAESDPVVQKAVAKLVEVLPQQDLPGRDIYKAALDLDQNQGKPQRALALHQYNAEHSPKDDQYTVWSLIEVVKAHIRAGNEPAATQARQTMLTRYAELENLPDIVYLFGDIYIETGQYDRAEQLYTYIEQTWPGTKDTLWSQVGRARSLIHQGRDDQAEAVFQQMMAEYASHPRLVEGVRILGESYWDYIMRAARTEPGSRQTPRAPRPGDAERLETMLRYRSRGLEKFELIIKEFPEDDTNTPFAYHSAGQYLIALGQPQKAAEYYQKVCQTWPDYRLAWHLHFVLGRLYRNQVQSGALARSDADAMTMETYERLLDLYPTSPAAQPAHSWLASHTQRKTLREGEEK
jgi:tetratricopeptide (TPR) repeat protein